MLAKLYNWLFHACRHEWQIIGRNNHFAFGENEGKGNYPMYFRYTLQCKKCGILKNGVKS